MKCFGRINEMPVQIVVTFTQVYASGLILDIFQCHCTSAPEVIMLKNALKLKDTKARSKGTIGHDLGGLPLIQAQLYVNFPRFKSISDFILLYV